MSSKQSMAVGITAIVSATLVLLAIILGCSMTEYRSADSMRCVKGEIMVVNGVTMQVCAREKAS